MSLICLKLIEVDEDQAGRLAQPLGEGERLGQAVDEQAAVRQARERVVGGLLGQRGLGLLEFAHPVGLSLAEPSDLALLRVLLGQVGEREAEEVLTVDVQRRRVDPYRYPPPVAGEEVGFVGAARDCGSPLIASSAWR